MNSPYGSLDNNGGQIAYYGLNIWPEQSTTTSDDNGDAEWSQGLVGQYHYDDSSLNVDGSQAFVFDDSHSYPGPMGNFYGYPASDDCFQAWHATHPPDPTFCCTPVSYATNIATNTAFDMQSLQQVPPFDSSFLAHDDPGFSKHEVQTLGRPVDSVTERIRPMVSRVPRTLPQLLPNKAYRGGRGIVEHVPAHINKPDLFASLKGEQSIPVLVHPAFALDPDSEPKQQSSRFEGDLYTARWTKGEAKNRQGWCGYCSDYFRLKDSAYWYHLHYCHGVLSEGTQMPDPLDMREGRAAGSWEAQCGTCAKWIALASGEKGRTAYFRHVYKCQTPLKREGSRLKHNSPRKVGARSSGTGS